MNWFDAIGGYFELELRNWEEFHQSIIRLNTGRNAFEYILRANEYKKVYLPYYTCEVMLEPIKKLKLDCEFYRIDRDFLPVIDVTKLQLNETLVYNNYFGIFDRNANKISRLNNNIIIDNSQAFYTKPIKGSQTFYSARKFFGVPDGAYLYTNKQLDLELQLDYSLNRMSHLLGRIEEGAEEFYQTFKRNDDVLSNQPIKQMSKLTHRLMQNIDYEYAARTRKENFNYLHSCLKDKNELNIDIESVTVPMVYPYLVKNGSELKQKLISNKIFVSTYWPNVAVWDEVKSSYENYLLQNLVTLPIDQRYNLNQMNIITNLICND